MLGEESRIGQEDMIHLANTIKILAIHYDKLDRARQLTTINLIMKLAFTRRASKELIIPPLDDLKRK